MIQSGLIQSAHNDLVTDAAYDFYGLRLATCSLDQRIKVWQLDETQGTWHVEDDWKAHDAAISKVSWAHPEFGTIIASASFDRTVKVWEQTSYVEIEQPQVNGASGGPSTSSRWTERAILPEAKGTVRSVEFAPQHFGLKLLLELEGSLTWLSAIWVEVGAQVSATDGISYVGTVLVNQDIVVLGSAATISSDNHLRVYECIEQPSLQTWQLSEEVDVFSLPSSSPASRSMSHTVTQATPTQTSSTLDSATATLVAHALQQQQQATTRPGLGNREADGGWCISWCKDRHWGEIIAAGCGIDGKIKIIQLSPSRRPVTLLTLDPSPSRSSAEGVTRPSSIQGDGEAISFSVTSVAWAPSCGRSYHLIATGSRDGHVRIWKVRAPNLGDELEQDGDGEGDGVEGKWTSIVVGDFDDHKSPVGRVEWNITGTILSSAGSDGRVRLWKATAGSVWRPAGYISVEQAEDHQPDVEMEDNAGAE